jgi:hypothetical protein
VPDIRLIYRIGELISKFPNRKWGKESPKDYLIQQNDADYMLTWDPQHADIAESGELGITYGIFCMKSKQIDTSFYGTYTNVWKKQSDGKWKLLLNTFNNGLGN